jgi:protein-S-isoprenylcysteine O-methyltransferase Ste14
MTFDEQATMTSSAETPQNSLLEKLFAWVVLGFAAGLGGASLVAFGIFLYAGPFGLVAFDLGLRGTLALDAGLSMLFFVQHSWMVRRSFKHWLARMLPKHYLDAIYAIASGIALLAVVLLWQDTRQIIWQATNGQWWAARMIFLLALAVGIWGVSSLKGFDSFGLRRVRRRFRAKPASPPVLVVQGAYRWVRHPLYLVVLLMIWSSPLLTIDRLLFNMLWTIWIIIGAVLEERDLSAEFGDDYREYQRSVPMLLPTRIPGR